MNNIKCQNFLTFPFKIRIKHKFSLSINQNILKKKCKYQLYFHCFVFILVSYAFQLSYQQNIVIILISAVFGGVALIRGEVLIRGRRLFQCREPKVRRLLEGGAYLRHCAYQRKYGNGINGIYQNVFFFFSCPSPLSTSSNNIPVKVKQNLQTLTILKYQSNHQLNIIILKYFTYSEILREILFFFFTNLSQGNFLCYQRIVIITKNLNTARTPTEMKQNLFQ